MDVAEEGRDTEACRRGRAEEEARAEESSAASGESALEEDRDAERLADENAREAMLCRCQA